MQRAVLGDSISLPVGTSLPVDDIPSFVKVPDTLQYGDVVTIVGQNSKFLSDESKACDMDQPDPARSTDWAIVNPEDVNSYGSVVTSGSVIALRTPSTGRFLSYAEWQDGATFGYKETPERSTWLRVLSAEDAKNDVESTSRMPIQPKGQPVKPGELLLLMPQLAQETPDVDKYSVYAHGEDGTLRQTDSTFVGWQFAISHNAQCISEERIDEETGFGYKVGEEMDNIACCTWELVESTNNGVSHSEQRKCCDRTNLQHCVASVRRIKQCAASHQPDESVRDLQEKRKAMENAQGAAREKEKETFEIQLAMDTQTTKATTHEATAATHMELEEQARKIVAARRHTDELNKNRTTEMVKGCLDQMASQMEAMKAGDEAARALSKQKALRDLAEHHVKERTEELEAAQQSVQDFVDELATFSKMKAESSSPSGKAEVQKLIVESEKGKAAAVLHETQMSEELAQANATLHSGNYTSFQKHLGNNEAHEDNLEDHQGANGQQCVTFVEGREAERHAILKEEWEAQEDIAKENMEIKDQNAEIAVKARDKEAQLRAIHEALQHNSTAARALSNLKQEAFEKVANGGKCCEFAVRTKSSDNPRISKEECCNAAKCDFVESETVVSHQECRWHGTLKSTGCYCHGGYGGLDCHVKVTSAGCFTGTRVNGYKPPDAASCASCYECQEGAPTKEDGVVVKAGSDVCDRIDGKEQLCTSCRTGAGLLRFGDTEKSLWELGYQHAGRCQPYPSTAVAKATPGVEEPSECRSVCFPTLDGEFSNGKLMSCTKVCSLWSPLVVQHEDRAVTATALCHTTKDSLCHANATHSLSSLHHQPGHTCANRKTSKTAMLCYSKDTNGTHSIEGGYGELCEGETVPSSDKAVQKWLEDEVATSRWCCYKNQSAAPVWLKNVPSHAWCTGSAMQV